MLRPWLTIALVALVGCSVDVERFTAPASADGGAGGVSGGSGGGLGGGSAQSSATVGVGGNSDPRGACIQGRQVFADEFDRVTSSGWGTPEPGPGNYTASSGVERFTVDANRGRIDTNHLSKLRALVGGVDPANEAIATIFFSNYPGPTMGNQVYGSLALFEGAEGRWEARLIYTLVTNRVSLLLVQVPPSGPDEVLNSIDIDSDPQVNLGYRVRFGVDEDNRLRASAWRTDQPPVNGWLLTGVPTRAPAGSASSFGGAALVGPSQIRVHFDQVVLCDVD